MPHFDSMAWQAWLRAHGVRLARMWTVVRAVVLLRVRRVDVARALGRPQRAAPVSPAPAAIALVPGAARRAPGREQGTGLLPGRVDEPTTLLRTVPVPTPDLWDDGLHVAKPSRHHSAPTAL